MEQVGTSKCHRRHRRPSNTCSRLRMCSPTPPRHRRRTALAPPKASPCHVFHLKQTKLYKRLFCFFGWFFFGKVSNWHASQPARVVNVVCRQANHKPPSTQVLKLWTKACCVAPCCTWMVLPVCSVHVHVLTEGEFTQPAAPPVFPCGFFYCSVALSVDGQQGRTPEITRPGRTSLQLQVLFLFSLINSGRCMVGHTN